MSYADDPRSPMRHVIGISIVVIFHLLLIYALINGLGSNIVALIKQPLETKIIKDTKPPPPEAPPPPPPQLAAPPPPYVPPPDFTVANPPPQSNAITEVTHTAPPPAPMAVTAAPVAKAAVPDAPVSARPISGGSQTYPPDMLDDEREGRVQITCDVDTAGIPSNCEVGSSSGPSFSRYAMEYVKGSRYRPAIRNGAAVSERHTWTITYKLSE